LNGVYLDAVFTLKSETQPSAAVCIEWAPVSFGTAELHRLADTFSYFSVIFKQSTPSKTLCVGSATILMCVMCVCLFIFYGAFVCWLRLCVSRRYSIADGARKFEDERRKEENRILCLTRPNFWHKSTERCRETPEMRQWTLLNESAIKCRQSLITFMAHMLIMLRWGVDGIV